MTNSNNSANTKWSVGNKQAYVELIQNVTNYMRSNNNGQKAWPQKWSSWVTGPLGSSVEGADQLASLLQSLNEAFSQENQEDNNLSEDTQVMHTKIRANFLQLVQTVIKRKLEKQRRQKQKLDKQKLLKIALAACATQPHEEKGREQKTPPPLSPTQMDESMQDAGYSTPSSVARYAGGHSPTLFSSSPRDTDSSDTELDSPPSGSRKRRYPDDCKAHDDSTGNHRVKRSKPSHERSLSL